MQNAEPKPRRKRTYPSDPTNKGGAPFKWTDEKIDEIAGYFEEFAELSTSLFLIEFIIYLKKEKNILLNRCHLPDFCNRSQRFKDIYDYVHMSQEAKLLKGGTVKMFDSSMCKFLLSSNHGYTDRHVVQHEGTEPIQIVNYSNKEMKTWNQTKTKSSESV